MLLTVEWKLDILLQNQTEKQQSNTMIHKIEVDLIMKKSWKENSLKTGVSKPSVSYFIAHQKSLK